jgi:hypothetical protein
VDGRTVVQPKPRQSDVHVNAVANLLFVDIQLYVFPPADMVNVDVREKRP